MTRLGQVAGVLLAGAVLGATGIGASAQQTVPAVTKAPPQASSPPAGTAATKTQPATTGAKTAAKKDESVCKGLEEKPCRTNTECIWIAATKRQDGKEVKAYCRKKAPAKTTARKTSAPGTTPPPKSGPQTTTPATAAPATTPPPKKSP